MNRLLRPLLLLALASTLASAAPADIFARSNLVAWCIVPFDSKKRGPAERAEMVAKLGFTKVAYDWRPEHVATFETEILEYRKHKLDYFAFWAQHDEAYRLFEKHQLHPQIWVMMGSPAAPTNEERVQLAAKQLLSVVERTRKAGCQLTLYNHGGWAGEPENMVAVAKELRERHNAPHVGVVYNLHHGHDHVDRFPAALKAMLPYLHCLNLNGMTRDGEKRGQKILPLGSGELDLALLKVIRDSGYRGPIGIIGHTNDDVEQRLRDNLDGLDWLLPQLEGKPAGPKPKYRTLVGAGGLQPPSVAASTPERRLPAAGTGAPSLAAEFGKALAGGMLVDGKAVYRELPLTVEVRAKLNSKGGFNILVASDAKASAEHWELYSYGRSGVFSLYMPGRGGEFKSATDICDGQWHALAAIIEGQRVRLFVDGKLVHDAPAKALSGTPQPGGLAFGRLVEGGMGCDGLVDDVRLSKGVREINGVPKGPLKSDAQTVGLWNFDDLRAGGFQPPSVAGSTSERRLEAAGTSASKPQLLYTKLPTREATEAATTAATLKQLPAARLASIHALSAPAQLKPDGSADVSGAKIISLPNAQWTTLDAATKSLLFTFHADAEREVTLRIGCKRPVQTKFNNGPIPSDLGPPGWLAGQIGNIADPVPFHVRLRAGDNFLALTFTETVPFYFELDPLGRDLRELLNTRLTADFPPTGEARYYKLETVAVPSGIALEVGGMAFNSDGSLMVCTRRGEIWRYVNAALQAECAKPGLNRAAMLSRNPLSLTATSTSFGDRWELFATGLHEPLGLLTGKPGEVFVVQRSELTRIADTDGDGKADLFETLDQNCGVSASQHAYIFGPVRDQEGNLWGAISGIGVSGAGKYFGWSFKVTPKGEFIPWSKGLRSPNGLCMTPDGDLFITDNQGEWMGTSPLHHVSKDAFHGHPQALKWDANFKGNASSAEDLGKIRKLPAIQFPYGTMGQSLAEPVVDTTGGKFGPFAGQMFVCDESKCIVVRVALEKVDGEWQGACLPFRSGFQGGNNRAAFAPDGSLYVGQTDRGWGSTGGKSFGLQRLAWSGEVPFEIETVKLTADGFDVRFTRLVDQSAAATPANWSLSHYHYLYRAAYGSPQQDITPVKVTSASVSADGRTVRLKLPELRPGKLYELHHTNLRAADGTAPLHTSAYYTLNRTSID
ncbi:MAG: hypothetical protein RL514_180 [Verrucomicrobiota bacterium]|jgi:hypothetical protein